MTNYENAYLHEILLNDEMARLTNLIASVEKELLEILKGKQLILFKEYKNAASMKIRFLIEPYKP